MKKLFEDPVVDILVLDNRDIITQSTESQDPGTHDDDSPFNPGNT